MTASDSFLNNELKKHLTKTKKFLKNNSNLIITRADKGNVSVALNKDAYVNKMEILLGDRNTHEVVKKDPIKKMISALRELLVRWRDSEFISSSTYFHLRCSDGELPRAYGLPKLHKPNVPVRIIVSSINSPLFSLATFLHKIMHRCFPTAASHITNSRDLVKKLSNTLVDDNHTMVSLDAVSLFTNIPLNLAIDSIIKRWNYIEKECSIPKKEFIIAVNLILNSTYFTFNNIIYKQTFGTPMGSPLSPISRYCFTRP